MAVYIHEATPMDVDPFIDFVRDSMMRTYVDPERDIGPAYFDPQYFNNESRRAGSERQVTPSDINRAWIARDDGGVLVGVLAAEDQKDHVEIIKLHVARDRQRQGIGRLLMNEAFTWWGNNRRYGLEVIHFNPAIDFYRRLGFAIDQSVPPIRYDHYPQEDWPIGHHPEFWAYRMWREPGIPA